MTVKTFDANTSNGLIEIPAYLYGHFAVHKELGVKKGDKQTFGKKWVLSHIPTGLIILARLDRKRDAVNLMRRLTATRWDWSFENSYEGAEVIKKAAPIVQEFRSRHVLKLEGDSCGVVWLILMFSL